MSHFSRVLCAFPYDTVILNDGSSYYGRESGWLRGAEVPRDFVDNLERALNESAGTRQDNKTAFAFERHGEIHVVVFWDAKATFISFGKAWVHVNPETGKVVPRADPEDTARLPANVVQYAPQLLAAIQEAYETGKCVRGRYPWEGNRR
jgi:hypothetical protein